MTNSVKERVISPNVNMIAAIDTEGRLYLSMNQVKTDYEVFCVFI